MIQKIKSPLQLLAFCKQINTEEMILLGREQDRKKISMAEIDYNEKIDGEPVNSNNNG